MKAYRDEGRRRSIVRGVIWFIAIHEVFFTIGVIKVIDTIHGWFGMGTGATY